MLSALRPLALTLSVSIPAAQEGLRDLKSKDPAVREAAVVALAEEGGDGAEKHLLRALKDADWLVRLRAVEGLARHGSSSSFKPLLKAATEGPFRALRVAAVRALARVAPEKTLDELSGDLRGRKAAVAVTSLADFAVRGPRPEGKGLRQLERLLASEELAMRSEAARAWVSCAAPDVRGAALDRHFDHGDLVQQAVGLEMAARVAQAAPVAGDLSAARDVLLRPELHPVLERRAIAFAVAAVAAIDGEADRASAFDRMILEPLLPEEGVRTRAARVLEGTASILPSKNTLEWAERLCSHDDEDLRAAAAKALRAIGDRGARDLALARLESEPSARVRLQHVLTASLHGAFGTPGGEAALAARLADDPDPLVREAAAVALGREGPAAASVEALVGATRDPRWEVAVGAAVALGKTRADAALACLEELTRHTDWRLRGAAAVGLYHAARAEAIEPLLALLDDASPTVISTAHRALLGHAGPQAADLKPSDWRGWWEEHLQRVRFRSPEELRARREKYGYSVPDHEIYRGLDVVVVPGAGDHIEAVLDRLGIQYRTVLGGRLDEAGLHPFAILVTGCTGELEARDVEVVQWFVHSGGALFASCWALTYTVERGFEGLVTKYPSPAEVLDRVQATPVVPDSPYLTGIFDGGVVPIYELQGAHLIQVLDPERVEVLVDSPWAALRHGSGDLTAWFRAGHGVVLDSVNHFDLQGLMLATHLDGAEELMGYAVDHMGLSLERLREVRKERWWKSRSKAAAEVDDLSAFRILTNFVREKRISDG